MSVVALLGSAGALRIEHLYVASAFFGMTAAFFMPAMTAIIPELIPPDILQSGNAVRGLSRQMARIGGPVIGGLIVALSGPPLAFAIDAATFFASYVALWLARPPRHEPPPPAPFLEQVRAGISFTFSIPWLWITICIFALVNLGIAGPLIVALPLLVRDVLHADARVYGAIGTAVGIGELCGTFLSGQFPVRHTGVVMYVWAILTGVAVVAIGLVAALPEIFIFAFAQGLSLVGFGILWDTAVQRHVPKDLLGRVSSVDGFGSFLLLPLGPLVFAALVERVGPQAAFIVGGGFSAALCLAALGVRSIRELE